MGQNLVVHNRKGRVEKRNREYSGGKKYTKQNQTMLIKNLDPQNTGHEK